MSSADQPGVGELPVLRDLPHRAPAGGHASGAPQGNLDVGNGEGREEW